MLADLMSRNCMCLVGIVTCICNPLQHVFTAAVHPMIFCVFGLLTIFRWGLEKLIKFPLESTRQIMTQHFCKLWNVIFFFKTTKKTFFLHQIDWLVMLSCWPDFFLMLDRSIKSSELNFSVIGRRNWQTEKSRTRLIYMLLIHWSISQQ